MKLYLVKTPSPSHYTSQGQYAGPGYANQTSERQTADGSPILTFEGHTSNITGVGFHVDTKWLTTSSEDGTVKIWDTRTGSVQRNYSHGSPVNDVVIHPNQGELISCDRGGNVRIWDLGENKCSHQLIPEDDVSVSSVTVASDGSLLCAGNNRGNVFVWRMVQVGTVTSLVPVCRYSAHNTYVTRVLLSPDVKKLATCSADHTVRIWSVESTVEGGIGFGSSAKMPGSAPVIGTTVLTNGHSRPMNVVNGFKGAQVQKNGDYRAFPLESTLQEHQRWVWDCAFSADSAYLVTACSDHYARLWELTSQSVIRQYNGHHRGAVCVALNDYSESR